MQEQWLDIKGFENQYQISNYGRVRSLDRYCISKTNNQYTNYVSKRLLKGKILTSYSNGNGYLEVSLLKNQKRKVFYIHRLVAETFIPNPNNLLEVNHIDGNKLNNKATNLEWCTRSENLTHAIKSGLKKPSEKQKSIARQNISNLTKDQKEQARKKAIASLKNRPREIVMKQIDKLAKINRKSVLQYDLNGVFIKKYNSLVEAEKTTGIKASNIGMCCRNQIKQSGGYLWKYNIK